MVYLLVVYLDFIVVVGPRRRVWRTMTFGPYLRQHLNLKYTFERRARVSLTGSFGIGSPRSSLPTYLPHEP